MDPNVVINRVMRLARLDTTVFDEVRDDQQELIPAIIVAVASCLLAGLGGFLYLEIVTDVDWESPAVNTLILGSLFMAVLYGGAALVVYVVMAQFYHVTVDLQALIRTMGYAAFPLALSVLMFIPVVWPLFAILPLMMLYVTVIYAVQSASGAESTQVVIASGAGLGAMVLVLGLITLSADFLDAPMGAGLFAALVDFS